MLDTNSVSANLRRRSPRLDGWVGEQRCCLSAIVVAEIRYGLEKRPPTSPLQTRLRKRQKEPDFFLPRRSRICCIANWRPTA